MIARGSEPLRSGERGLPILALDPTVAPAAPPVLAAYGWFPDWAWM